MDPQRIIEVGEGNLGAKNEMVVKRVEIADAFVCKNRVKNNMEIGMHTIIDNTNIYEINISLKKKITQI